MFKIRELFYLFKLVKFELSVNQSINFICDTQRGTTIFQQIGLFWLEFCSTT